MDLQITVFLLFVLFTAGHSIRCHQCTDLICIEMTCPAGLSNCFGATIDFDNGRLQLKSCAAPAYCPTWSINLGTVKGSSSCCNTDLCNAQDAPAPPTTPNGNSCFYCDDVNCLKTMRCSGTEDRCIKATGNFGSQSGVVKGCVSNSLCDAPASFPNLLNVTCCEGNLCNGVQSVTQSFLFLCCSLISYFLLH